MHTTSQTLRAGCRAIAWTIVSGVILIACFTLNPNGTPRDRVMAASAPPGYARDVAPILQKNCIICHSHTAHKSGLVMENYESLMKGGEHGPSIIPRDAAGSRLVAMLEGGVKPRMPLDDDPLSASDIATIKEWINAGAIGPAATETAASISLPPTPDIQPEVPVSSPVASLKFSPDGKVLAVGGY